MSEGNKTINVAKAFNVVLGGVVVPVAAGVQSVPAEIAEHWYTALHLANGGFGTEAYALGARATADQAFMKAKSAALEYEGLERAAREAEEAAGLEPSEPSWHRLGRPAGDDEGDQSDAGPVGPDTVEGAPGPDTVEGNGGPDTVTSPTGPDTVVSPDGADTVSGSDTITSPAGPDTVEASNGADTIEPSSDAANTLASGAGNDTVSSGDDTRPAAEGNDTISTSAGSDTVAAPAADPYPNLSPKQEAALDRIPGDGVTKPGGSPPGGNRPRHRGTL